MLHNKPITIGMSSVCGSCS